MCPVMAENGHYRWPLFLPSGSFSVNSPAKERSASSKRVSPLKKVPKGSQRAKAVTDDLSNRQHGHR